MNGNSEGSALAVGTRSGVKSGGQEGNCGASGLTSRRHRYFHRRCWPSTSQEGNNYIGNQLGTSRYVQHERPTNHRTSLTSRRARIRSQPLWTLDRERSVLCRRSSKCHQNWGDTSLCRFSNQYPSPQVSDIWVKCAAWLGNSYLWEVPQLPASRAFKRKDIYSTMASLGGLLQLEHFERRDVIFVARGLYDICLVGILRMFVPTASVMPANTLTEFRLPPECMI